MPHPSEVMEMANWKAESDAHTLTEAKAITQDDERFSAAESAAKRLAEEEAERAENQKDKSRAMEDLAEGSLSYGPMQQRQITGSRNV
jgi:hypothetical protein